jgi:hypothetical protein
MLSIVCSATRSSVPGGSFTWGLYLRGVPDESVELAPLPNPWAFRTDPDDVGVKQAWFAPDLDDSA